MCVIRISQSPVETTAGTALSRASRLIVRNLPFDITEQDLRAIFLPYGPMHSIHIPLAEVGDVKAEDDAETKGPSQAPRSKGFAFVWMLSKKDAESALAKCNGMKVVAGMANDIVSDKQKRKKQRREEKKSHSIRAEDGDEGKTVEEPEQTGSGGKVRVIAVDWALSKERWAEEKAKLGEASDGVESEVEMDDAESDASAGKDSEANSEHEQLGLHEEGSGDEEDEDDDGEDNEPPERGSDEESPGKPRLPHTDTGNTLFIRNVPFTATEDEIRTLYVSPFFLCNLLTRNDRFRAFGPLRYVRLTMDPQTERPRGTGFACFWNKEDADKAIKQSEILRTETVSTQTQVSMHLRSKDTGPVIRFSLPKTHFPSLPSSHPIRQPA